MRLHSDWAFLEQQFGCSIRERFLMAIRSLDNPKAVTPFLVERGAQRFGLFMHVERGNVEAARIPPDIQPVYYKPYFNFERLNDSRNVYQTLLEAVESVADGEKEILLDPAVPLSIMTELQSAFLCSLEDWPGPGSVTLRQVATAKTTQRLRQGRGEAAKAATRLIAASPVRERIFPYLEATPDDPFAALDRALADAGLSGVIVSSTLNAQEIGAVPAGQKYRPLAVIYVPGRGHAWVMEHGVTNGGRQFSSPKAALKHVLPLGCIGIESEDVSAGLARALELESREWRAADGLVRRWRDENALADLPYYIIASRTTRHAIEAALGFARKALERAGCATEMDSYDCYLRAMREFAPATLAGLRASRTLTNFHCGSRTIFPANPAAHPLGQSMNTLKIDAGCLLFDAEGFMLGCSDIARTLTTSEAAEQLYVLFGETVRRTLIPAARAGCRGREIHGLATEAIWSRRQALAGNPLFVELARPSEEYDRDVGHLLGKNNLAHLRFIASEDLRLREGMIACCEYQWPIKGHAIAFEDTCLVTPSGGLNITSDDL